MCKGLTLHTKLVEPDWGAQHTGGLDESRQAELQQAEEHQAEQQQTVSKQQEQVDQAGFAGENPVPLPSALPPSHARALRATNGLPAKRKLQNDWQTQAASSKGQRTLIFARMQR